MEIARDEQKRLLVARQRVREQELLVARARADLAEALRELAERRRVLDATESAIEQK